MYIFVLSLLTISLVINNSHCVLQDPKKINEISSNNFNNEFQKFLKNQNPSSGSLVQIVKEIGSSLLLVQSKIESSKPFESEVEVLRKDVSEAKCSLSTRIIDIENDISQLKKETGVEIEYRRALSFARRENVKKILMDSDFFLTPNLQYLQAKMHCFREGGTPFVPKTKDEFHYTVEQVTKADTFGWLPLTDLSEEGKAEWDDGTSYEDGPFHFTFVEPNKIDWDCVVVKRDVVGYWTSCTSTKKMLCLKTEST